MNKYDYLNMALKHDNHKRYEWILNMITRVFSPPKHTSELFHARTEDGLHEYWDGEKYLPIEGSVKGEPLFRLGEPFTLRGGVLKNAPTDITTTFGRALINGAVLSATVGDVLPYKNHENISIKGIENELNAIKVSDPADGVAKKAGTVTTSEFNYAQRAIEMLASLSNVIVIASTEKLFLPPKGFKAEKARLLKEYEKQGKDINDPIVLLDFQKKMSAYDAEFLSDDPKFKHGVDKKTAKSRMKVYMSYGKEAGFSSGDYSKTITRSLKEGLAKTPEEYAMVVNTTRSGSLQRGSDTALGGVTADILARVLYGLEIQQEPCNTKMFRKVKLINDNSAYVGRMTKNGTVIDKDFVKANLGKEIEIRSPYLCAAESFCRACVGERMGKGSKSAQLFGSGVSAVILSARLKKFHGTVLTSVRTDLNEVIS